MFVLRDHLGHSGGELDRFHASSDCVASPACGLNQRFSFSELTLCCIKRNSSYLWGCFY